METELKHFVGWRIRGASGFLSDALLGKLEWYRLNSIIFSRNVECISQIYATNDVWYYERDDRKVTLRIVISKYYSFRTRYVFVSLKISYNTRLCTYSQLQFSRCESLNINDNMTIMKMMMTKFNRSITQACTKNHAITQTDHDFHVQA